MTTDIAVDLSTAIASQIEAHPRSQQTRIGPSEIGTPCARRLGHKLANTPDARTMAPAWRPTVGTAVHAWLADTFLADNLRLGRDRWLVETRVWVGDIDGVEITGHVDLYDCDTAAVIDFKVVGITTLRTVKKRGPDQQYRTQVHTYGRGMRQLGEPDGLPVTSVNIAYLPSSGELRDLHVWSEPYNEQVALDALDRASGIAAGIRLLGGDTVIPQLLTADAHCNHCPWLVPATSDLAKQCPGDPSILASADMMSDLLPVAS